jgi:hypothetical protein
MEPIKFSIRGCTPQPYSNRPYDLIWCNEVAAKAKEYAVTDLSTIPLYATFAVTLHFYRRKPKDKSKQYDTENLAKATVDTLFHSRDPKGKFPTGALFPDRQGREDLGDYYVFEEHIYKHVVESPEAEGADITVELRDEIAMP